MAFAPQKSPLTKSKNLSITQNPQTFSQTNQLTQNIDQASLNRLDIIENSLNRVCNQHDALMPLLKLLESIPQIERNEKQIKIANKKIIELEQKVNSLDNSRISGSINKQFQFQQKQVEQLSQQIKQDLNLQNSQLQRIEKFYEQNQNKINVDFQRKLDSKLDSYKKDVNLLLAEFKNNIQIDNKKIIAQSPIKQVVKQEDSIKLKAIQESIAELQTQIQLNNDNIYREIGMMRIELESFYDHQRKNIIISRLNESNNSLQSQEQQKILIANLEQQIFLDEVEVFDQSNQERLLYEILCLQEKLKQSNIEQQELKFIEDRLFSLNNQIHGTKKKYLLDLNKIEDKLTKLQQYTNTEAVQKRIERLNNQMNNSVFQIHEQFKKVNDRYNKYKKT